MKIMVKKAYNTIRARGEFILGKFHSDRSAYLEKFDADFYKQNYGDLLNLRDDKARKKHFIRHGKKEGRFPNAKAQLNYLQDRYGALPDDFNPKIYKSIYDDLRHIIDDEAAKAHYLKFGRNEGRKYLRDDTLFDDEFKRYVLKNQRTDLYDLQNFHSFLKRFGLESSNWTSKFILGEFIFLNQRWLSPLPETRMEGIVIFVEKGIELIAPISNGFRFDVEFYKTVIGIDARSFSDADLYRYWLNIGNEQGESGNEGETLLKLIGEENFPSCFDEKTYRKKFGDKLNPLQGRTWALDHYINTNFAKTFSLYISGEGADKLYENISKYFLIRNQMPLALIAIEKAIYLTPDNGYMHHIRGDILKALDRTAEATEEFAYAASKPNSIVWSHIHAIEGTMLGVNGHIAALEMIAADAPRWQRSAPWRQIAFRAICTAFEEEERCAHALYISGRRADADALVNASLARTTNLIELCEPLPAQLPSTKTGSVIIIANRDLPQCDHYRVAQKYMYLKHGGWSVEVYDQNHSEAFHPALEKASVVIFYRVAARPVIIKAILYARFLGVQTIYEIDDIIFDSAIYPDSWESFDGQITIAEYAGLQLGVPLFRYAMKLCDVGLVTTPALMEAVRPLVRNKVCHLLRNGLDVRNISAFDVKHHPFSSEWVTIFYGSGTKAHSQDFTELAAPALLAALKRHSTVRLVFVGHIVLDRRFDKFFDRIFRFEFDASIESYWELLSAADINIAVLSRGETTDAKSEIKWLEAAIYSVPSIVSDTQTYREILTDGHDALIARNSEEWVDAIERLIEEPKLRRKIGFAAQAKALAQYTPAIAVNQLSTFLPEPPVSGRMASAKDITSDDFEFIKHVKAEFSPESIRPRYIKQLNASKSSRRLRIMIVHIYFFPEVIGGATRVVKDNVDYIIDNFRDEIELAVVTSDPSSEGGYRTRTQSYRGIPVHRIATKQRMHMDLEPFDREIEEPFTRIFERFAPDFVHYHCVQRLTASVIEPVRKSDTPYFITLHDAWWISDFQFLFDDDNRLHKPSFDPLQNGWSRNVSRISSIARQRKLRRILNSAAALISVSESFADIYRSVGYPKTRVMSNGVSNFDPVARISNIDGRVRLGHIGNRSAHKGATLIEIVLKSTDFKNITLTMVEAGREPGYIRRETWGTTPVELIGPTPQAKVAELYARLDVLLAPSLWPESFGLVTREAKAAGLWVVASNIGSIGEDINDGIDGHLIDVSNIDGLRRVLLLIESFPERYMKAPPSVGGSIRTSDDQGQEIVEFYKEFARVNEIKSHVNNIKNQSSF